MKKVILAIIFLLPIVAFAQTEADKFYNKGRELYKAQKYDEAIPYFEKSRDLDENDKNRYASIHWLARCYYQLGNYANAIRFETQAIELCKKVRGEEHTDCAALLNDLASYNKLVIIRKPSNWKRR